MTDSSSAIGRRQERRERRSQIGWTDHGWVVPEFYNMSVDVTDDQDPNGLAMIFTDHQGAERQVGWAEVQRRTRQIAGRLTELGVGPGDRVAVLLPQRPDTPASYLGVLRTGAILVTMSLLWADEPIRYRLSDSEAAAVITDASGHPRLGNYRGLVIDVDDPALDGAPTDLPAAQTRADDPALIFYTSGTTGSAKGIVHAQRTLLGHNEFTVCHDLRPDDVFYGAGDWAWSLAKLFGPMRLGVTQFVYRPAAGLDPAGLFESLSRHRVTTALMNPTFLRKVRQVLPEAGSRYPQRFRTVCSSNEPLDAELIGWFRTQFGVTVRDYYGSTESYPMIGNPAQAPVQDGRMGRALPGWDVALLDDHGHPVPDGTPGEICLRARSNPQFPLGYWNRPEQTAEVFGPDWYRTLDQAVRDADGVFDFLGRTDDVIKTSGYRVSPFELEAALRAHPAVRDAGVVGVPDELRGQAVQAFVELKEASLASDQLAQELVDHVREHYSRFAYPRVVIFSEQLPRSATGKVQRAQLRDAATTPST